MPAYTSHGWAIPGSTENWETYAKRQDCGGPKDCSQCEAECEDLNPLRNRDPGGPWTYDYTKHNDDTLSRVNEVMLKHGMNENQSHWLIIDLLNNGILFRERT